MSQLTSSLYSGISGLSVHSQAIAVVGNNLANSNTVGYKTSNIQFEDMFYSTINTSNGLDQVGHGASVSTIYNSFGQGTFEASAEVTDIAISGNGFFIVTVPGSGTTYYTRSGNFSFNEDGYLVNANGFRVQGWDVEKNNRGTVNTVGSLGDLQLDTSQSSPLATSLVTMLLNLDLDTDEASSNTTDPFFAMMQEWDGTAETPLGETSYSYQATITVYDEAGTSHDLTIYYDPVQDDTVASDAGGNTVWEYMVTCAPSEDGRTIDGQEISETSAAGLLMSGTLTFNSSGDLLGQTAFTLPSTASGDLKDLSNWTQAEVNDDGYAVFTANFTGSSNASATDQDDALEIAIDFGVSNLSSATNDWSATVANAAALGNNYSSLFNFDDPIYSADATTCYDSSFSVLTRNQNGYGPGFLSDITIDSDGVVSGTYTNNQTIELFIIGLANFDNLQGLTQEGENLYSESSDSGLATTGTAGNNGLGDISSNTLELSNVDLSTEMVKLITYQRGYQANSKIITTVDSLLQEAINLKR